MTAGLRFDRPAAAALINPRAGLNAADPTRRAELRRTFSRFGPCVETDASTDVDTLVRDWHADGIDRIVVCGGDGTLHTLVNALVRGWTRRPLPQLSLVHGGTTGLVARSVADGARYVYALDVGGRLCFNLGFGAFVDVPAAFVARGAWQGAGRFVAGAVVGALAGSPEVTSWFAGFSAGVALDGAAPEPGPWLGLYATALDRGGLGPLPGFDGPPERLGRVRVLTARGGARGAVARALPLALGLPTPGVAFRSARALTITGEGPLAWVADGERYASAGPIAVRLGPAFEFSPFRGQAAASG